jgi:hypothetical protein
VGCSLNNVCRSIDIDVDGDDSVDDSTFTLIGISDKQPVNSGNSG